MKDEKAYKPLTREEKGKIILSHRSTEALNAGISDRGVYYQPGDSIFLEADYENPEQLERAVSQQLSLFPCNGIADMKTSIFPSKESSTGLRYLVEGTILTMLRK